MSKNPIYSYRNRDFCNPKSTFQKICNDLCEVCTAGSCNFDIRSFRLNFESNAFIYDRGITGRMNAQFEEDMKLSREYTQTDRDNISLYERLAESISRLLTEIL